MVHRSARVSLWIVEEHPLAARYLLTVLNKKVVRLFPGRESLRAVREQGKQPPIFLLDAASERVPLEVHVRTLKANFPGATILALGRPGTEEDLCRLLLMGLQGFCSYEDVERNLIAAIRCVSEGHLWFPANVLEKFPRYVAGLKNVQVGDLGQLTHTEELVLGLLERRMSNKEISTVLGISERTVRFHLGNVFAKLGVHDRYSAVDVLQTGPLPAGQREHARYAFTGARAATCDRQTG